MLHVMLMMEGGDLERATMVVLGLLYYVASDVTVVATSSTKNTCRTQCDTQCQSFHCSMQESQCIGEKMDGI